MELFNSQMEILKYLEDQNLKNGGFTRAQLAEIAYPVFMSDLVKNDIQFMMTLNKVFEFKTGRDMFKTIGGQLRLSDDDLTLFQLHVLCGLRGPATEENFETETLRRITDPFVQAYAQHKDFPGHLKAKFYEETGETCYLPKDAQDIFIF